VDFTEARDSEWQWHRLDCMPVCTLLQTENHASTPSLSFYRRIPFLPPNHIKALKANGSGISDFIFISVKWKINR